ncbi:hypothetical protein P8452_36434 [Trifolium repens]|nr:hypothetical protein P8452_36434 [Trifolium repens]
MFYLHHSFFANTDVGHEKSSFLDDLLATLQTYQMEFDAQCKIGKPPSFTKEVTFYDMYSGTLILPWYGFGEHVFEFAYSELVLIDNCGDKFPCKLRFGVDPEGHLACKISGGWTDYCTVHGVSHHDKLRFSVVVPQHNYELYVSFSTSVRGHS